MLGLQLEASAVSYVAADEDSRSVFRAAKQRAPKLLVVNLEYL